MERPAGQACAAPELGISSLSPSNEKGTPASILACSSAKVFPTGRELVGRGGCSWYRLYLPVGAVCSPAPEPGSLSSLASAVASATRTAARVVKMCVWPPREVQAWLRRKGRLKVEQGRRQARPRSTLSSTGRPATATASAPSSSPSPAGASPGSV